jgi:hypothetical protein
MFCLRVFVLSAFLISPVGVSNSAMALNPLRTDILTLRLGMTREQVVERLAAQGYRASEDTLNVLRARTLDGGLIVRLGSDGRVRRVDYTFNGKGPSDDALIRSAVIDHYGLPTAEQPLAWCGVPTPDRKCSRDQPLMLFDPGKNGKPILTLALGGEP